MTSMNKNETEDEKMERIMHENDQCPHCHGTGQNTPLDALPFAKEKGILGIGTKKTITTKTEKSIKPIEPILLAMRGDDVVEIREGIQPGRIRRDLGKGQGYAFIDLPPSKLRKFAWGKDYIAGFIIQDNHARALPLQKTVDSVQHKQGCEQIVANRSNMTAKNMEAVGGMIFKIAGGLALIGFIIFIAAMAGVDPLGLLKKATPPQNIAANTASIIYHYGIGLL